MVEDELNPKHVGHARTKLRLTEPQEMAGIAGVPRVRNRRAEEVQVATIGDPIHSITKAPYSLGIVGAGEIVANLHLPVLKAISDVRIAWITDINHQRAKSLGRAFGVLAVPLPADLLALPEAEIVLLAIPYGVRAPYYEALRDRPCALYVEKPFAKSMEEHLAICGNRQPFQIACGFQRRSLASVGLVKSLIEDQTMGPLQRVEFGLGRRGHARTGTHMASVSAAGGGLLFQVGVHGLDTLLYFTGAQDAHVDSASVVVVDGLDVHVDAALTVTRNLGPAVPCRLTVSCLQDTTDSIKCIFEWADLSFSIFSQDPVRLFTRAGCRQFTVGSDSPRQAVTVYETAVEHWRTFLGGLRTRDGNRTSAYDSLLTSKILEEIYAQPPRVLQ
jgi:predicted dehydrogenase